LSSTGALRAAAVQLTSIDDPEANLETADRLTRAAIADGARLVVLPESWNVLGTPAQLRAAAEPLDGPAIEWARATAREFSIDIVAGSIVEQLATGDRHANTSAHIGPNGDLLAVYRKIHLFDVEVGETTYRESDVFEPGSEVVCSALQDGVDFGMAICYDLRFPELFRRQIDHGVRLIVLPSDFTLATTREHWEVLLRARAIENQCFVIAPNQVGLHPNGNRSGGRSLIVDPWGVVIAQAADGERHVTADLDFSQQDTIRGKLPALRNRRLDDAQFVR
jgi:predicted amidohydrolase